MAVRAVFLYRMLAATMSSCLVGVALSDKFEVPNPGRLRDFPFQNTSLPWNERVNDLVSRLTLEEIQLQMARGGAGEYGGPAPAIPRLGIGTYQWDTECLRGDAETLDNATAFPQALGLAATFSPDLLFRVASATGAEVRGKHNDFVNRGIFASHTGASCFSPVINIARDPRWGRNQETYGEDPFLTGVLSQYFVRGLQGNDPRYVQASAGCKHFDAHGGPENIPVSRMTFNAVVSDVDWHMTFLPAFKKCVQAGTFSLMCSYNRLNGIPSCANKKLLTDVLRGEWNFTGYVVSDESAIENIINDHHYLNNSIDTAAACVTAGCNLELSPNLVQPVYLSIVDAVKQGKLSEDLVRERVKPLFYTRMRLGEFDPPENNPYSSLNSSVAESSQHQALAVEAAVKSFVLLKNQLSVLPLKPSAYKKVAVIGPMANNVNQIFGNYSPNQDRSFTKTPLEGLKIVFPTLTHGTACLDGTPCKVYNPYAVKNTVNGADLIFVILGTGPVLESEDTDRADVNLPGKQEQLLLDTISYNQNATIILLLFNAGPLNVSVFDESARVSAIMECFFPAQATGDALIAVLTNKGNNSSPAGRLPMTWYRFSSQIPPMVNYSMEGRTYRYMDTDPLYPFGYGLSYSLFLYLQMNTAIIQEAYQNLTVTLTIQNFGDVDSDEVVQCYIRWENQSLPVPQRQLVYFNRIPFKAGQIVHHTFNVSWDNWAYWDNGKWEVQTGDMTIFCGGQQPFQKKSVPSNILAVTFPVIGSQHASVHSHSDGKLVHKSVRWNQTNKADQSSLRWNQYNKANQSVLRWNRINKANKSVLRWNQYKANQSVLRWNQYNKANQSVLRWNQYKANQSALRWNRINKANQSVLRWNQYNKANQSVLRWNRNSRDIY